MAVAVVVASVAVSAVVNAAVVVASVAVNALVNAIIAMAPQRAKRHAANAKSAQRVVSRAAAIAMKRRARLTPLQLVKKTATKRAKSAANAVAEVAVVRHARHANKMPTAKCKTKMHQREKRQQHAALSRVLRVSANARRAVVVAMVAVKVAVKVARAAMVAVSATQKPTLKTQ